MGPCDVVRSSAVLIEVDRREHVVLTSEVCDLDGQSGERVDSGSVEVERPGVERWEDSSQNLKARLWQIVHQVTGH